MKKSCKVTCLLIVSVFISMAHFTNAWARPARAWTSSLTHYIDSVRDSLEETKAPAKSVYDSLHLDMEGLSRQAFDYAQRGWKKLRAQGKLVNSSGQASPHKIFRFHWVSQKASELYM